MLIVLFLISVDLGVAQDEKTTPTPMVPVATQWVLNGARNEAQRGAIKSVVLIICPKDNAKGTGFVLAQGGAIITASHVVGNCTARELAGTSALGGQIVFSNLVQDANRDIALLCPTRALGDGMQLGADGNPQVETEVETWGYPLTYNNFAPILSRGYVAGYSQSTLNQDGSQKPRPVKHLIINGAFNPGNSGGPLIDRSTGKVIGIVVQKWTLFSPLAVTVINGLKNSGIQTSGGFQRRDEHGQMVGVSNEVAIAAALKEFYDTSQVMIGEAISVSELSAFLREKQHELGCNRP